MTARRARAEDASVTVVPRVTASSDRGIAVRWWVAAWALVFAAVVSYFGSGFIPARFPDRPRPRDLLFELLPHSDALRYVNDVAILVALGLLVAYAWRHARAEIPGMVAVFAIFYTLRAAIMVLTPLALAHGDGDYFALLPVVQNGDLSGHAGATLLCFLLLVGRRDASALRRVQLGLVLVECVALLVSRSHYSIDIIGGLLLAYFVWREWTDGSLFAPMRRLFGR